VLPSSLILVHLLSSLAGPSVCSRRLVSSPERLSSTVFDLRHLLIVAQLAGDISQRPSRRLPVLNAKLLSIIEYLAGYHRLQRGRAYFANRRHKPQRPVVDRFGGVALSLIHREQYRHTPFVWAAPQSSTRRKQCMLDLYRRWRRQLPQPGRDPVRAYRLSVFRLINC
jgi:hypothetical protein